MILSTHFLAGAALASYTDSPVVLIVGPIILHLLLDTIPHWEYVEKVSELKNKIPHLIVDLFAGPLILLIIAYSIYNLDFSSIIWLFIGGVMGDVPDGFTLLYTLFPKNKFFESFYKLHGFIHNDGMLKIGFGLPLQVAIDFVAVALIALPKL